MKTIFFAFILLFLPLNAQEDSDREELFEIPDDKSFKQVERAECIVYRGYDRLGSLDIGLQFYNTCGYPVWAQVCVEERRGKLKLYESSQRIPSYGYYRINLFDRIEPNSIKWVSRRSRAQLPENFCSGQ